MKRVVIVDSEDTSREQLKSRLEQDGCEIVECDSISKVVEMFLLGTRATVLLRAPAESTHELLNELRVLNPPPCVIVTCNSLEQATSAVKEGAVYASGDAPVHTEVSDSRPPPVSETRAISDGRSGVDYRLPSQGIKFSDLEREVLLQALRLSNGNQTRAASLLGLTRDQIRYRMAKFSVSSRAFEPQSEKAA